MLPNLEPAVRVLVLLVYIVAATWAAFTHADSVWFVLHGTGALAGLCAASMAVSYAGLIGAATPGPVDDQGAEFMERTEWDD